MLMEVKQSLVDILRKETTSLLKQYLEFTEKYAQKEFILMQDRLTWTKAKWLDSFDVKYQIICDIIRKTEHIEIDSKEYHRKNYYRMQDVGHKERRIINDGYDKFLKSELDKAHKHYESSIEKLAFRIEKKNLIEENLEVRTSHIGVNINTTLTDGIQTVRAFTIMASGEIQRPHFRYLIK